MIDKLLSIVRKCVGFDKTMMSVLMIKKGTFLANVWM